MYRCPTNRTAFYWGFEPIKPHTSHKGGRTPHTRRAAHGNKEKPRHDEPEQWGEVKGMEKDSNQYEPERMLELLFEHIVYLMGEGATAEQLSPLLAIYFEYAVDKKA